jgi:hypothetical protein
MHIAMLEHLKHYSAHVHASCAVVALFKEFSVEVFPHLPYNHPPDLTLSYYQLSDPQKVQCAVKIGCATRQNFFLWCHHGIIESLEDMY